MTSCSNLHSIHYIPSLLAQNIIKRCKLTETSNSNNTHTQHTIVQVLSSKGKNHNYHLGSYRFTGLRFRVDERSSMFGSTPGSTLVESVCSVELGVESSTLDSSLGEDTTGGSVTLVEGTICSGITMEGER